MVDDPTTNARVVLRREGSGPGTAHLHAETGRGRGSPSVLLCVPSDRSDSLAALLAGLHDPRGPADLDVRLGRLAAAAPPGTAFAVAVGRSAWVFPSTTVTFRRLRDGRDEPLDRPEVVTLRPGDRVEMIPVDDGPAASAPAEAGDPGAASAPRDRVWATLELPAASAPPSAAPPPDRPRGRAKRPSRPAAVSPGPGRIAPSGPTGSRRAVGTAAAILGVAVIVALGLRALPGGASGDAASPPPTDFEGRIVGMLAGDRSDRPTDDSTPAPKGDPAEARARVDPAAGADGPREVDLPPAPVAAPTWAFRTRAPITSSPLVVDDTVVFGCRDSTVYCLDTGTGETRWAVAAGDGVGSSPTRSGDTILVGTYAGRLLALDADDGSVRWSADAGGRIVSSPCVVSGRVIVGSYANAVHAWSVADGSPAWRVATSDVVRASPEPVDRDGVVVGSGDGTLWCLDAASGAVRWRRDLGARILAQAAWDPAAGRIFAGTADGALAALQPSDGTVLWRKRLGAPLNARPRPAGGLLLAGTGKGRLVALDPADGSIVWEARAERGFDAEPLVLGDRIVAPSYDGVVHVLALADGSVLERRPLDAEVFTSPAADTRHVYLGTLGGTFHALALP